MLSSPEFCAKKMDWRKLERLTGKNYRILLYNFQFFLRKQCNLTRVGTGPGFLWAGLGPHFQDQQHGRARPRSEFQKSSHRSPFNLQTPSESARVDVRDLKKRPARLKLGNSRTARPKIVN